jgi:nucleotide-binding universal stress UspA family protein
MKYVCALCMIKNILIPTSNFGLEDHVIRYVAHIFPAATFHIINVVDVYHRGFQLTNLLDEELTTLAEKTVKRATQILHDLGIKKIETTIVKGVPSKSIIKYAKKHDIHLIAIGVSNKKKAASCQMGSTCRNIIIRSTIPILTLADVSTKTEIKKILFPTDGTRKTNWAKNYALLLSEHLNAQLEVLCVLEDEKDDSHAKKLIDNVEWKASFLHVKVKKTLVKGKVIDEILEHAKKNDIIIMGCGRRVLFWQTIGHVTKTVVATSSIPVIFVSYFKKR